MTTVNIPSLNRDIELKPFTRAISRAINEKLLEGVNVESDDRGGVGKTSIPTINADRSEELGVRLVSGLTEEEMDNITVDEYETLRQAVNKETQKKTVKTNA